MALAASALAVSAPAAAQTQTPPFSDTSEDAFYSEAVGALADGGVFDGTECAEAMLCPGESIDRKTMAVWIVRALDGQDPAETANSRFSDVAADSFHGPFIERMADLGVTAGCGDGTAFCPDGTVTRDQMAVFLTRAFDLDPGPDPGFSDVAPDAWYYNSVAALAASRITAGCGDGTTFCPHRPTTRAQMATFLARATGLVELPTTTPDSASPYPATIILPDTVVHVDATGQRHTTNTAFSDNSTVSISPDGSRIAFFEDGDTLHLADTNGNNATSIAVEAGWYWSFPVWSPDSSRLAYNANPNRAAPGLYVLNDDGSNHTRLIDSASLGFFENLVWSPDSRRIAFADNTESAYCYGIWSANADGSGTQKIAQDCSAGGEAQVAISWSPDGSGIAYTLGGAGLDGRVFGTGDERVDGFYLAHSDGTGAQRLANRPLVYEFGGPRLAWSPEGSHLAMGHSDIDDVRHQVLVSVDGTRVINTYSLTGLITESYDGRVLGWSPDGRLLAYGRSFVYKVFSTHADRRFLSLEEAVSAGGVAPGLAPYGSFQQFSPDGRNILSVLSSDDGSLTLTVHEADLEFAQDNPGSVQMYSGRGLPVAVFSPDGSQIAYVGLNGIVAIDVSSGSESLLVDYSDIVSDRKAESDRELEVCKGNLSWTQTGIQGSIGLCRTSTFG